MTVSARASVRASTVTLSQALRSTPFVGPIEADGTLTLSLRLWSSIHHGAGKEGEVFVGCS